MKNHGGNGPFKCSVCNFTADIKQSLTVHEMNHHIPPLANSMDIERTIDDTPPENINIFDMVSSSSFYLSSFILFLFIFFLFCRRDVEEEELNVL
jgi:hypothetical protein